MHEYRATTMALCSSCQSGDYLVKHRVGFGFNLRLGLVLNRMQHINGIEVRASECGGLGARGRHELVRSHWNRWHSQIFQS